MWIVLEMFQNEVPLNHPPKKNNVCQQKLLGWEILRYIQLEQMGTMERLSCCMGGGSCGTLQ